MKKYPCFVPKCSIGECTRTHNAIAHKNLTDYLATKKRKSTPQSDNTPPNFPPPITPRTGAKGGNRRPKRKHVKGVEGLGSGSDQTDDGGSQPENEDEEDRKPHPIQRIVSEFSTEFWMETAQRLQKQNEASEERAQRLQKQNEALRKTSSLDQ